MSDDFRLTHPEPAPRRNPCTCGRRCGEGHALMCARVFDTYTPGVIYAPASTEAA